MIPEFQISIESLHFHCVKHNYCLDIGYEQIVQMLVFTYGAIVNVEDADRNTPLNLAVQNRLEQPEQERYKATIVSYLRALCNHENMALVLTS